MNVMHPLAAEVVADPYAGRYTFSLRVKTRSSSDAHTPEVRIVGSASTDHPVDQPEARRAGDQDGKADLRGEPPLHRVEQRKSVDGGRAGNGERQDEQRHKTNCADPTDDGKDVQGARQNKIIDQVWAPLWCGRRFRPGKMSAVERSL